MDKEPDGFPHASINDERCVSCGRCKKVCPTLNPPAMKSQVAAYAAQSTSPEVLKRSASGGAFFELARTFLRKGGTVYGAAMRLEDSQARIAHQSATSEAELVPLQNSKYAQGDASVTFRQVEEELRCGKHVLFSGLPCQVAGLYGYLGRDWPTLTTIDIFCHGNTSEAHLNLYLRFLHDKYHQDIVDYTFRDKERGAGYTPRVVLANGKTMRMTALQEAYWYLFQNSKFYRLSCHACPYACGQRVGDISLGDFWGIEQVRPEDRTCGISAILANTTRGDELVRASNLVLKDSSLAEIVPGGAAVRAPQPMPQDREHILELFRAGDYAAVKRYCIHQMGTAYLVDLVYDRAPVRLLRRLLGRP